jgi:CheY-like chemotaxis protein
MPVMDGLTATKLIRTTLPEPARNVKIIAMTANVMQEDVQEYFNIGMNAYVSKPFNADELLLKMDAAMGNTFPVGKKQAEANDEPVAPPVPVIEERKFAPLPSQVTDMTFLKGFTGGNMEKQQKYTGMFLTNAPKLLESIDKGLANNDYETVKIAAHSLKPQLSYMGVKEEVSNIFLIEQSSGESAHRDTLPDLVENLKRLCDKAFEELRDTM